MTVDLGAISRILARSAARSQGEDVPPLRTLDPREYRQFSQQAFPDQVSSQLAALPAALSAAGSAADAPASPEEDAAEEQPEVSSRTVIREDAFADGEFPLGARPPLTMPEPFDVVKGREDAFADGEFPLGASVPLTPAGDQLEAPAAGQEPLTPIQRIFARQQAGVTGSYFAMGMSPGVAYVETAQGVFRIGDVRDATMARDGNGVLHITSWGESGPATPINPVDLRGSGGETEAAEVTEGFWGRAARNVASILEPFALVQDVFFAGVVDVAKQFQDHSVYLNGRQIADVDVDRTLELLAAGRIAGELTSGDGSVLTVAQARELVDAKPGSLFENLSQIQLLNYAPGGEAPVRPVSGEDLLRTLGVKDESALKWGGIAMDLVADPLLAGAAFRAAGRTVNAAARLGRPAAAVDDAAAIAVRQAGREVSEASALGSRATVQSLADDAAVRAAGDAAAARAVSTPAGDFLINLGNTLDEAMSVGGVARAIWQSDSAAGRLARDFVDGRLETIMRAVQNEDTLAGRFGRAAVNVLLPPRQRAQVLLGDPLNPRARVGAEFVEGVGMGRARGAAVFGEAASDVSRLARETLGLRATGWGERMMSALTGTSRTFKQVDGHPEVVVQTMLAQGFDVVDNAGVLRAVDAAGNQIRTGVRAFDEDVARVQRMFTESEGVSVHEAWTTRLDTARAAVREAAEGAGITDARKLAELDDKFVAFTEGLVRIDSRLGLEQSGYGLLRDRFITRFVEEVGGTAEDAADAWVSMLHARLVRGEDIRDMRFRVDGSSETGFRASSSIRSDEVLPAGVRAGDFLETDSLFAALDLNAFVDGLAEGHLRRAYALWGDTSNLNHLESVVTQGRMMWNNLVPDSALADALGADTPLYQAFRRFTDAVGGGQGGQDRLILRQDAVVRHLTEDGIRRGLTPRQAAAEANDAWARVVSSVNGEDLRKKLSKIQEMMADRQAGGATARGHGSSRAGEQGVGPFSARQDFTPDELGLMGELMDALTSITESANIARQTIPLREAMRSLHEVGIRTGRVVRVQPGQTSYRDAAGVKYRLMSASEAERSAFGAFASSKDATVFVHPQLYRELQSLMKQGNPTMQAFNRVRSLVAGGYLASPNMAFVNLAGAIFSATIGLNGANPLALMRNMIEVAPEVFRRDSVWHRKLSQLTPIDELNQVATTVTGRDLDALRRAGVGNPETGVVGSARALSGWYEQLLNKPGGVPLAGLDGFQLIDQWVRTAAFKTHYEARRMGGRTGLLRDAMSDGDALTEAADLARLSALDYSELPKALTFARDTGLVMFPGFPYLMLQRNLDAALNRPGGIALYDRLQDAIVNAVVDPAERAMLFAGMPDWLKESGGVPISQYVDENGDMRWRVIPFADIIPSRTQFGGPMLENLSTLGLMGPLFDITQAIVSGTGEAPLAGQFGQRVFTPESGGLQRVGEVSGFLWNSFAPAFARRLYSPSAGTAPDRGLLPAAGRATARALGVDLDPGFHGKILSFNEYTTRRADRSLQSEIIATLLRSPQDVVGSGPMSSIVRTYNAAHARYSELRRGMADRARNARAKGDVPGYEMWLERIRQLDQEFIDEAAPLRRIQRDAAGRAAERRRQGVN